ncbi:hypothetical protein E3D00_01870 [Swingsia samuiensis]|uniref:Uncharacterized protein n=2 Tax=Swingsia samuiensis TaxID=1293412 RepID=A0A4Y6ULK5_9PROT|nr:hypothetical protein E3D00_01870 [Swingsia samuiensis]
MDADLEAYLDESVRPLQEGADKLFDCKKVRKTLCSAAKESQSLVQDLTLDQPWFVVLSAFVSGVLLARLWSAKK